MRKKHLLVSLMILSLAALLMFACGCDKDSGNLATGTADVQTRPAGATDTPVDTSTAGPETQPGAKSQVFRSGPCPSWDRSRRRRPLASQRTKTRLLRPRSLGAPFPNRRGGLLSKRSDVATARHSGDERPESSGTASATHVQSV